MGLLSSDLLKMKWLEWVLMQSDWCPQRVFEHTNTRDWCAWGRIRQGWREKVAVYKGRRRTQPCWHLELGLPASRAKRQCCFSRRSAAPCEDSLDESSIENGAYLPLPPAPMTQTTRLWRNKTNGESPYPNSQCTRTEPSLRSALLNREWLQSLER